MDRRRENRLIAILLYFSNVASGFRRLNALVVFLFRWKIRISLKIGGLENCETHQEQNELRIDSQKTLNLEDYTN